MPGDYDALRWLPLDVARAGLGLRGQNNYDAALIGSPQGR